MEIGDLETILIQYLHAKIEMIDIGGFRVYHQRTKMDIMVKQIIH